MLNIAHRGASGILPENSIEAFISAISCGVDMIEMDVRQCKTKELVVFHDYCYNDTPIEEMTLLQCQQNNIESLHTILERISNQINVYLDLKVPHLYTKSDLEIYIQELVKLLEKVLNNKLLNEKSILLASFDHNLIKKLKIVFNNKKIYFQYGLIFYNNPIEYNYYNKSKCDFIIQSITTMNIPFLKYCKKNKINFLVYTINDEQTMKKLINLKVDGIITDYPRKLKNLI
jgi:glycerophosphoryl diester phosphodiesterase